MLTIKLITEEFAVCQVEDYSQVNLENPFVFTGATDDEKSLVCPIALVPENALSVDKTWSAFRIEGVLDFSLIGILSKISSLLAENNIGIFAISTYNTDYILTKTTDFQSALRVLEEAGYQILG
ncbi:ACT domain-containing protein [Streptococcus gallolyticus subsp. gallolyticus]|uniref:ACT domain-containing protein n=1 Tax=Streptococcus gallolyticus TaxID=315405 RepID=UPI0020017E6F|nr:ACT domain-containing protein [Streptococcus gallolyticus]MCY7155441.1 ACT domain-containing protein [Streptococcus gallolyticus subsp. gallolyticus]MCY7174197.1 ACT domain-containing protein [Streptococcus gallolyticus subsp. gallolyticus]MCY7176317.1 ACT domain-containing protein [Streptococcus gallolyticus subsp. gallolyticus]MCY7180772.1 ACT domain-containing protein [Streptococcus gallolyticus subsp. gallolyticus]MCY7198323.1 ACT domain-containing protein [Streptococcus gallolyticus su